MTEWNDPSAMTLTFQVEASEDMKAFFDRMQKESKEREEAYNQILQVFAIGYQCGWNDHYSLLTSKTP